MVSLGKTATPEFGSPCYTEPEGRPPAVTPVGPHPDGRRLLGRRGRRGGGRAGPRGPGLGRWRLDPDPGLVLRAVRPQAHPRADQWSPPCTATRWVWRPPGRSPGPCATRRRCSTCSPVVGWGIRPGRRLRPASFLAACDRDPGRLRIARFIEPVIADVDGGPRGACTAWEDASRAAGVAWATRSWTSRCRCRREAVPVFETCWAVLTAMSVVAARAGAPAAAADPLARRARAARSPARSSGWRSARCGGYAAGRPRRARAVRRGADADPGRPAAAGRRDPRRRRPGRRLRGAEGVHALDVGLERHRHAGRLAAAALDRRRACRSG